MKLLIIMAMFLPLPQISYIVPFTEITTDGVADPQKIDLVITNINEHLQTTEFTYCPRTVEIGEIFVGIVVTYTFECYIMEAGNESNNLQTLPKASWLPKGKPPPLYH